VKALFACGGYEDSEMKDGVIPIEWRMGEGFRALGGVRREGEGCCDFKGRRVSFALGGFCLLKKPSKRDEELYS